MTKAGCRRFVKNRPAKQELQGFTLVEFAVVMLISGFILAAAMHAYKVYLVDKNQRAVYDKLDTLNTSFSVFTGRERRYPCPSDASLSVNDINAGIEQCAVAWALAPNTCTPSRGICRVDGSHSTPATAIPSPDPVFIGGVPYKTIRQFADPSLKMASLMDILDPWGFQMTYAVSATQTDTILFNSSYGVIDVQTEAGVSLIRPPGTAHFILISHGENHKGAFNQQGRIPFPCTTGTDDAENCDRTNAVFVAGLRNMGQGPRYYDDVILQKSYVMSELWRFADGGATMYNNNAGNVGLGISEPTQKLDVSGDVRATSLMSNTICDQTGQNCWSPAKLGGAGMSCGPASAPGRVRVMRGISQGEVEPLCAEIDVPTILNNQRCTGEGEYAVGFTYAGYLICAVP
jgi:prepilin-type N-terminal cleavage/methylation domain-containing protein